MSFPPNPFLQGYGNESHPEHKKRDESSSHIAKEAW